jgi:cation diffusion facilitator CzcD-associated flavoprotein CzcO
LVRTFFYEYSRFEDAFNGFTLWLQKRGYLDKESRRALRDSFYAQIKDAVRVRNVCLHDVPDWGKQITPEISILAGLDLSDGIAQGKLDGKAIGMGAAPEFSM